MPRINGKFAKVKPTEVKECKCSERSMFDFQPIIEDIVIKVFSSLIIKVANYMKSRAAELVAEARNSGMNSSPKEIERKYNTACALAEAAKCVENFSKK